MRNAKLEFLSAVLIVSDDGRRLARFYRDQLGIPLRPEQHGETLQHWGASWATFTLRFIHARTSSAIPTSASAPSSWPSWSSPRAHRDPRPRFVCGSLPGGRCDQSG